MNDLLEQGRDAYRRREWGAAFEILSRLDEADRLPAADLWRLAVSAFLTGRFDSFTELAERSYHSCLESGDTAQAVRCAFWLGGQHAERGDTGRASGWFARAQRLLDGSGDSAEQGLLLMPVAQRQLGGGDFEAAFASGAAAIEIAERFGDADLLALALHVQGRVRMRQARVDEGLALLDEAMVSVAGGEVSPIMTGLIYCSVISACRSVWALRRAREWTVALSDWCAQQPDLVTYAGQCLANRAEIMRLRGAWGDAVDEARKVCEEPFTAERRAVAAGFYQRGEVERLRGDFAAAEEAYRAANRWGLEPQPGLALLRLAQGDGEAAAASMRRALGETGDRLKRARLLPAQVEIALAAGAIDEARAACDELSDISAAFGTDALTALAAHARGAVELASGDPAEALTFLRRAWRGWQALDAPYETARVRVLVGQACRALGDDDTAALEFEAARGVFDRLGAAPDLARVEALAAGGASAAAAALSRRELEVLRLVASGASNKSIAAQLAISDRTVERHVSNIFDKLGVNSRAAATSYAYRHGLL